MKKIITHPGQAHRDEFLACCWAIARPEYNGAIIERREPTQEELADQNVLVLDIGGSHNRDLNNFDHHQFDMEARPTCAFSLLLMATGEYHDAINYFPWLAATEVADSKGPFKLAERFKIGSDQLAEMMSPIENSLLIHFGKMNRVTPGYWLYDAMLWTGANMQVSMTNHFNRMDFLCKHARRFDLDGVLCLDVQAVDRNNNPALAVESFCKLYAPDVAVVISLDDRGQGLSLFRRNDDSRIDFSRIKNEPEVLFAHANGFIAKTREVNCSYKQLIEKSIVK